MDDALSNDKILAEAKARFKHCQTYESQARNNWRADYRFGHGDSTNLYQWQGDAVDSRSAAGKPCFTVNRTRNYCLQIINDAKQNKADIQVRAVGAGASFQSAQILEGVVRHITYISNAEAAYEQATYDQVFSGIGWWRVCTDYAHDDSFDQEIFIKRVPDALSIYMDPMIQETDGSDANYGFVFIEMDKDEFRKSYPKYKDAISDLPFDMQTHDDLWLRENHIRVCEYYRKTMKKDTLHHLDNGQTVRESDVDDANLLEQLQQHTLNSRDITVPVIEWYMICGDKIVDKNIWPGRYIPLVRVIGTETIIDGELDRFGHVRALIDPNRAYNYYTSAGIEFVANQTKSPWLADIKSIEGVEEYWRDSNIKNYAVLPFKSVNDDGNPLEPPRRADPPVYASAFLDGMKVSASEMELVSGQPPAAMGDTSNERSGKAVLERQRAASNGTYHFVNNLSSAIRFTGKILIDLIPHIYDTERTLKILSQDGTMQTVKIDPNAPQAHTPMQALDGESFDPQQVAAVLNPNVGEYDVVAEVGPQYTTRRQEFVSATMDILAQNESLTPLIGDLVFRSMDFPGAAEIADRMRRVLAAHNPAALGNSDPQIVELQKQLAQQHAEMAEMAHQLQQAKSKAESIAYMKEIDLLKAQTERLKVLGALDPDAVRPIIREEVSQIIGMPVNAVIGMHLKEDALMTQEVTDLAAAAEAQSKAQQQQQQGPQQ